MQINVLTFDESNNLREKDFKSFSSFIDKTMIDKVNSEKVRRSLFVRLIVTLENQLQNNDDDEEDDDDNLFENRINLQANCQEIVLLIK